MSHKKHVRILIADDTIIARKGFTEILQDEKDFKIVGFAESAQETPRLVLELSPDIVIMDLVWWGDETAGWTAIRELKKRFPELKVIAITGYGEKLIKEARNVGADFALTKNFHDHELINAIRELHLSRIDFSAEHPTLLSEREQEVLLLIANGETDKRIAVQMMISENTVKSHIKSIFKKLGVDSRIKAINKASDLNII
jgi:DNA-binding NarL/FixJ family response regulator